MSSLTDSFTDTTGTLLEAHTGESGGWTLGSGATGKAEIRNSRLNQSVATQTKNSLYVFKTALASANHLMLARYVKQATAVGGENVVGVTVRADAEGKNLYRLRLNEAGKLTLEKRIEGTYTVLSEKAGTAPTTGEEGTIRLEVNGSTLIAYRNGAVAFEKTDASITEGKRTGLFLNRSEGAEADHGFLIDSVEAKDLEEASEKPAVITTSATTIRATTATVKGTVNPKGKATEYRFEYSTDESFSSHTEWQSLGATDETAHAVEAALAGLTKFTTYHFRVVAKNAAGESQGGGAAFKTAPIFTDPVHLFGGCGQSNEMGEGKSVESPALPAEEGFKFEASELKQLADPVGPASSGSCFPALGKKYFELTGKQAVIVNKAVSGSAVLAKADIGNGNWSRTGALFATAVAAIKAARELLEAQGATVALAIHWCQGEREAQAIDAAEVTKAEYKAALEDVIAHFREELGAELPLYISRTGRKNSGDTTGFQQVREAQEEVAAADPLTWVVFKGAVNFPAEGKMNPEPSLQELHYSQVGYNEMGEGSAEGIVAAAPEEPAEEEASSGAPRVLRLGATVPGLRL